MKSIPEVTIIGVGGLGQSLAKALITAEIPIKSIFNRTAKKTESLAIDLGISIYGSFPQNTDELGDVIFITVTDQAIKDISGRIGRLSDDFSGRIVVHCSGNESADLFNGLKDKGANIASFHPLQTFTDQSSPEAFKDIFFSLQGDKSAFLTLKEIARQLGAQTIEVTAEQKSYLHAAAVMASNYLNILLDAAVDTASVSGLSREKAKQALFPLIKTSLKNIKSQSFKEALTGPIKRGDITTVEQHLKLLQEHPDLLNLYKILGTRTVKLVQKSQNIDDENAQTIRNLLE